MNNSQPSGVSLRFSKSCSSSYLQWFGEPLRRFSPFHSTTYTPSARKNELVSPPAQVPSRLLG